MRLGLLLIGTFLIITLSGVVSGACTTKVFSLPELGSNIGSLNCGDWNYEAPECPTGYHVGSYTVGGLYCSDPWRASLETCTSASLTQPICNTGNEIIDAEISFVSSITCVSNDPNCGLSCVPDIYENACDSTPNKGSCSVQGSCENTNSGFLDPICVSVVTSVSDNCNNPYYEANVDDTCQMSNNACTGFVSCSCLKNTSISLTCSGCNPDTHECSDLTADEPVGSENTRSGWCSDGIDNDCDGLVDRNDPDCPVFDCVSPDNLNPSDDCAGSPGDLPTDEVTDGAYCDTNNGNKCCPPSTHWNGNFNQCVPSAGCKPDPCTEEPFTNAWWSDSDCITASEGCCYQDTVKDGAKFYDRETHVAYN